MTAPAREPIRDTKRIHITDVPTGEYFIGKGELLPAWYPSTHTHATRDLVIAVHPDGTARLWRSLGVWEHV